MRRFPVMVEWGPQGTRRAAERGDAIVIVDVIGFSTAAVTLCGEGKGAFVVADETELQIRQQDSKYNFETFHLGRFCHHPEDFNLEPGWHFVMPRDCGAFCTRIAKQCRAEVFVGSILNARATAGRISQLLRHTDPRIPGVTVVACGEYYPAFLAARHMAEWQVAMEDFLGVGAILSNLTDLQLSSEGLAAVSIFETAKSDLGGWIDRLATWRSEPERECPVSHTVLIDRYDVVPTIIHGCILTTDYEIVDLSEADL